MGILSSTSNTFSNCWGADKGGAIYLSVAANFTDSGSSFYNNSAVEGGALYCERCTLTLTKTKIYNNRAWNGAGGVLDSEGTLTATEIEPYDNVATNDAGVFKFGSSTWFNIGSTTFSRNYASMGSGAVIYALGTSTTTTN